MIDYETREETGGVCIDEAERREYYCVRVHWDGRHSSTDWQDALVEMTHYGGALVKLPSGEYVSIDSSIVKEWDLEDAAKVARRAVLFAIEQQCEAARVRALDRVINGIGAK